MSLQVLLAEYPNYPAREVRKLAKQLNYLSGINSKESAGISSELISLHLMRAKVEAQLNDDVPLTDLQVKQVAEKLQAKIRVPSCVPEQFADKLYGQDKWQYSESLDAGEFQSERICVTPHLKAIAAINRIEAAIVLEHRTVMPTPMDEAIKSARGMVNGPSFYTDRTWVKVEGDHGQEG